MTIYRGSGRCSFRITGLGRRPPEHGRRQLRERGGRVRVPGRRRQRGPGSRVHILPTVLLREEGVEFGSWRVLFYVVIRG